MEKYGVLQEGRDKTKTAAKTRTCPDCGGRVATVGNTLSCEKCGTKPFESK